jgi:hypothetical protein
MELTLTSVKGFNTFRFSDYSLKQFLNLLQFSRDAFQKIRDDRVKTDVVNSLLKDIDFDIKSEITDPETLRALTRRTDLRALFLSSVFPVQYLELLETLKIILAELELRPLAVIIEGENDEFLNLHVIIKQHSLKTSRSAQGIISYDNSSKELLKHLQTIDNSIGPSTTLIGIKIIASDIGNPERMIVSPYILEVRCSNGMMMVSPQGERRAIQLPIENPERRKVLREFFSEVIKGIEQRSDPLINSYKELQDKPIPRDLDPLDIIYGLRRFDRSGFSPTRIGTTLGARGRIFAAEDLRIYRRMMTLYRDRIQTIGDLINLISAGANGVYDQGETIDPNKKNKDTNMPLLRSDVVWRNVLIQSASGILVTLGHDQPKKIIEHIHRWSTIGKKVRERDMGEIDMGDSAIRG